MEMSFEAPSLDIHQYAQKFRSMEVKAHTCPKSADARMYDAATLSSSKACSICQSISRLSTSMIDHIIIIFFHRLCMLVVLYLKAKPFSSGPTPPTAANRAWHIHHIHYSRPPILSFFAIPGRHIGEHKHLEFLPRPILRFSPCRNDPGNFFFLG